MCHLAVMHRCASYMYSVWQWLRAFLDKMASLKGKPPFVEILPSSPPRRQDTDNFGHKKRLLRLVEMRFSVLFAVFDLRKEEQSQTKRYKPRTPKRSPPTDGELSKNYILWEVAGAEQEIGMLFAKRLKHVARPLWSEIPIETYCREMKTTLRLEY